MPSEREIDCRQRLLPAEAECTSILWERKQYIEMQSGCFANEYFTQTQIFFKVSCLFSGHYLPSWVPIHTVPAVSPDIRQERLCQKEELSKHCYSQNVFSKLSVLSEGILRTQNISENLFLGSCCSLLYRHWPTGGTAQMQRAGAVGGRLNWSRTVLDRAGSITVISLLKAGPETTHTEHWHKSDGYGVWKDEWHETTRPR